eukprot:6214064-Pleurochrysis_carterae.AAC.4
MRSFRSGLAGQSPSLDLGARVDDAFALERGELLACPVVAEVDVVAEVFFITLENATLLVERGDRSMEARQVVVVTVGPDVLESDVANPRLGAAGSGRAVIGGLLLGRVAVVLARREESRKFPLVLRSQLAGLEVLLVCAVVGKLGRGLRALRSARLGRHAAHTECSAAGSGGEHDRVIARAAREQCLADGGVRGVGVRVISVRGERCVASRLVALLRVALAAGTIAVPVTPATVPARAGLLMPFQLAHCTLGVALGSDVGRGLLLLPLRLELVLCVYEQSTAVRAIQL